MRITESQLRRLIRESIQDDAAAAFAAKVFGTPDSRTDLYDSAVESWAENESGLFQFSFKPAGDKLEVTVSAADGADERSASRLESETQSAVANLTPADWSGLSPAGYVHSIPGGGASGVTYTSAVEF